MAFGFFPSGGDASKDSLEFIVKEEIELRARYEKAKADKLRLIQKPPTYFNPFQYNLAVMQADEDINNLSILLLHLERKLAWEKGKKWKGK